MMMTSERKNNRGKIQIMGDVLALGTSGIKKTHIMYRANLSYEQVHLYLGELIAKRLIAQDVSSADGIVYRTTEKGREFLHYYTRLTEFLEEVKGEEEEGGVGGGEKEELQQRHQQQQPTKVALSTTAATTTTRAAAPYISG